MKASQDYYIRAIDRLDFVIDDLTNIGMNLPNFTTDYSLLEIEIIASKLRTIRSISAQIIYAMDAVDYESTDDESDDENPSDDIVPSDGPYCTL